MQDLNVLLATLAQSAAAVVAIIGGFLVSRLVALSSERDGLRRQRTAAEINLARITTEYEFAHAYRFENSKSDFEGWVLDDVIEGNYDEDALLEEHMPRGSSEEEMRLVLRELDDRVARAFPEIRAKLRQSDSDQVDLDGLRARGLDVPVDEEAVYESVLYRIRTTEMSSHRSSIYGSGLVMPPLNIDPGGASLRRFDESIRDEQNLLSRKIGLEQEIERLDDELAKMGRPAGVTSAIVILSIHSLLGVAAPLIVMVAHPSQVPPWAEGLLLAAFLIGLSSVLGYIYWYARSLNSPQGDEKSEGRQA